MTGPRAAAHRGSGLWLAGALGCLGIFLIDLVLVVSGLIVPEDRRFDLLLHGDFGSGTDPFFSAVSTVAAGLVGTLILIVIAVGLVIARRYLPAVLIVLSTTGAAALDAVVKLLVRRPRPELFHHAVHASGYSFPSGHSTNTFAFFAAIVFLLVWLRVPRGLMLVVATMSVAATLLVGLSRITLGVHYPTDVVGGYAISAAWCIGVLAVLPGMLLRPNS